MPVTKGATATVNARIQARYTRTDELGEAAQQIDLNVAQQLAAADVNLVYAATLEVDSGASPVEVPLYPQGFDDGFGDTAAQLTYVYAVQIRNLSDTHVLRAGLINGDAQNGLFFREDTEVHAGCRIGPGGTLLLTHPEGVSVNSGLWLEAESGVINADVVVVGNDNS